MTAANSSEGRNLFNKVESAEQEVKLNVPIVRVLEPEGVVQVLESKGNLNSKEYPQTYFYCQDTETNSINFSYDQGAAELGSFLVFPKEANTKHPSLHANVIFGLDGKRPEIVIDNNDDDPEQALKYNDYLFVPSSYWNIVKNSQSIAEAYVELDKVGVTRDFLEKVGVMDAKELIENRRKLDTAFYDENHPLFQSDEKWTEFYSKYLNKYTDVKDMAALAKKERDITLQTIKALKGTRVQFGTSDKDTLEEIKQRTALKPAYSQGPLNTRIMVRFIESLEAEQNKSQNLESDS